jgi:MFS family permease
MEFPLLRLKLFRIRSFACAIAGSFATRLGIGGLPFLMPLLYQIGLGYTPVQSGLLIIPQTAAAMGLKMLMPVIIRNYGFRRVLVLNTVAIGVMILVFMSIGPGTPVWLIAAEAFLFGFFSSLQFTSMNTLVYADLDPGDASMGSSITSTVQQMSMSFGVAISSLLAILFLGGNRQPGAPGMVGGIHKTFLVLGLLTIASSLVFRRLRPEDGDAVSLHRPDTVTE